MLADAPNRVGTVAVGTAALTLLTGWVLAPATAGDGPGAAPAPVSVEEPPQSSVVAPPDPAPTEVTVAATLPTPVVQPALPEGSGVGRRVVLSVSAQRMWWVDDSGSVLRSAAVSGRAGTPRPGTFQVYSKTLNATGLDGSHMDYFVRFTEGTNGWAIGFHDIPVKGGLPVQTEEQLGTPLSHGCIRQAEQDAEFTWEFLDVGSTVVVVA